MKLLLQKRRNRALTLPEVLVVVGTLVILAVILLPVLSSKRHPSRINCVSNLKQVDLAFRIWESDHDNKYPMAVSVTNGGAMETTATGDVVTCFICMSNELSTPKVLICPVEADLGKTAATNFGADFFNNSQISYFIGVDGDEAHPQRIMSGDDNFVVDGSPIKSGLVQCLTNTSIAWGADRHQFVGNIGFADGSVMECSSTGLQTAFQQSDLATNRLAIP
jgi:prepilin-type processing-associated H-X9-DG protein